MNTTRKLFGLALAPLYFAIAQVESENGVTSRNMYQLTRIFLDDCETLTNSVIKDDVVFDRQAAEQLMFIYWRHSQLTRFLLASTMEDREAMRRKRRSDIGRVSKLLLKRA